MVELESQSMTFIVVSQEMAVEVRGRMKICVAVSSGQYARQLQEASIQSSHCAQCFMGVVLSSCNNSARQVEYSHFIDKRSWDLEAMTSDQIDHCQTIALGDVCPAPKFVLMPLHQTLLSGVWKGANENCIHFKPISFTINCHLNHRWLSSFFVVHSEMVLIMPKVPFRLHR